MKLLVILSVIACSHAAKLDRTYLPPASAATAGGSPGSLNTPVGPSGSSGPSGPQFGLPNNGAFGKTAGALNQPGQAPSSQYGQPVGPSFDAGFAQPSQNFGQVQNFGQAQGFGQGQNYQRNQPERAQAASDQNAEILRSDSQNDGETYSYNFETSNGIAVEESGVATNGVQAQGAFSYSDDDGQMFRIAYTADENGFQPQGDHLPTPHPIPDEILKSIEQNARAAAAGTQEGAYNPEEDNDSFGPQQYSNNAPNSYNQGPAGPSAGYNQPQAKSPSALYGAPNAASPSQGFQGQRPQGPSQQYNAPNGASGPQSFQGPQQYNAPGAPAKPQLSQQYGAPNGARPQGLQGPSQQYGAPNGDQSRPSFNQPQGKSPSALYGAPNGVARPNSFNGNQYQGPSNSGSNGFAASASAPRPSSFGPAQSITQQYQAQPQSQGQFNRPQGPTQAQDESGYQYNRPQGSFGRDNGPSSQQNRPQNGAGPSGSQGSFPKSNGAPQGSFGPAIPNSFGSAAGPNALGPKGNFGPAGQGSLRPAGPSQLGPSRPSFGSANQGPSQKSSESGYEYNQPGSQGFGPSVQGPRPGFPSASGSGQTQGQNFRGPQQAPSFSEEEGYKY